MDRLAEEGWDVVGLSRNPLRRRDVRHVSADLTSVENLREALAGVSPTHVFYTAWSRRKTEQENIDTNAGMLRNVLASLNGKPVKHVALMTGLKHYLGPFEAYAAGEMPDTPFRESSRGCRRRTSTTPRKTSCGLRPRRRALAGPCTGRIR